MHKRKAWYRVMKKILSILVAAAILASAFVIPATANGETENPQFTRISEYVAQLAEVIGAYGDTYALETPISTDDMKLIMSTVRNEYPEYSYLSSNYSYQPDADGMVHAIYPKYTVSEEEAAHMIQTISDWISRVVSGIPEDAGELERAMYLHDYLVENFEYDTTYTYRTLYDFITLGTGVCQGYTNAYTALLRAAGIGVSWAESREMNHVWNLVCIDGKWYHADVTWDDPVGSVIGRLQHTYFLLSDSKISEEDYGHHGWVSPYYCPDKEYDSAYFRNVISAFRRIGTDVFYLGDTGIYSTSDIAEAGALAREYSMRWNVWGSTSYYTGRYSTLAEHEGKLYFNSSESIVSFDPTSGNISTVYKYSGGDGYIYGFRAKDIAHGDVSLCITKSPDSADKKFVDANIFQTSPVLGDADNDGAVTVGDAILVLKQVANWSGIEINTELADTDHDGDITVADAIVILKIVAGWNI